MTRRSARCYEEMDWLDHAAHFLRSRLRRLRGDILTWRERRRWDREAGPLRPIAASLIPADTYYCYGETTCPFWHATASLPEMSRGYCSLLRVGDWHPHTDHLWDQVKACGINERDYGGGNPDAPGANPFGCDLTSEQLEVEQTMGDATENRAAGNVIVVMFWVGVAIGAAGGFLPGYFLGQHRQAEKFHAERMEMQERFFRALDLRDASTRNIKGR